MPHDWRLRCTSKYAEATGWHCGRLQVTLLGLLLATSLILALPSRADCPPVRNAPWTQPDGRLRIAAFDWNRVTNSDGTGLLFDLLAAVFSLADASITADFRTYRASYIALATGKAEVMAGVGTVEPEMWRELPANGTVTSTSVFWDEQIFILCTLTRQCAPPDYVLGPTDRVINLRGYDYAEALELDVVSPHAVNAQHAIAMLDNDDADQVLIPRDELEEILAEEYLSLRFHWYAFARIENFLAFTDDDLGHQLVQTYNCRVREMRLSGELETLYRSWGVDYPG